MYILEPSLLIPPLNLLTLSFSLCPSDPHPPPAVVQFTDSRSVFCHGPHLPTWATASSPSRVSDWACLSSLESLLKEKSPKSVSDTGNE